MHKSHWIIAMAMTLGFALVFGVGPPAVAQSTDAVVSPGLLCDTHDQVVAVITDPDHDAAMKAVNDAAGHMACVVGLSAYVPGPLSEPIEVPEGMASVQQIVLLAVSYDGVSLTRVTPTPQYTAVLVSPKPAGLQI